MQLLLIDLEVRHLGVGEHHRVTQVETLGLGWLVLIAQELVLDIVGIPELVGHHFDAYDHHQRQKHDHACDVRPDIDGLVVAGEKTFEKTAACVVVDAVAARDVLVVFHEGLGIFCIAHVGLQPLGKL